MDSLKIDSGVIRLAVNGDESRVISFDPTDILFAEKFYQAIGDFETRLAEYQARNTALEAQTETDGNGVPLNTGERIALLAETCRFVREKIDNVFGAGTSQAAFGDALNLEMFNQFFDGITPYFRKARSAKVEQYINPNVRRSARRNGSKK